MVNAGRMKTVEGFGAQAASTKSLPADALPPFIISEPSLGMGASLRNNAQRNWHFSNLSVLSQT